MAEPADSANPPRSGRLLAAGFVLAAASLWGTVGTWIRVIGDRTDADAGEISLLRSVGAVLVLGGWLLWWDRSAFRLRSGDAPRLALFGLTTVTLFYLVLVWTFERTSVAVGTLLLYLAPALVTLGAVLILGEPLTRHKLVALGLTFGGCLLVVEAYRPAELAGSPAGIGFGVMSALCYTAFSLGGKRLLTRVRPATMLFYHFAFGALGLLAVKALTAPDFKPSLPDSLMIVGSGVATTLLPIVFFTAGLRRLPAGEASILATWEPVVAIVLAGVVLGEGLSVGQAAGAACVIGGVVLLASGSRRAPALKCRAEPTKFLRD